MHRFSQTPRAIWLSGVFCLFFTLLFLATGCSKRAVTPAWQNLAPEEKAEPKLYPAPETTPFPQEASLKGEAPVHFVAFNLRNYLTMERTYRGKKSMRSKPEEEIQALVSLLAEEAPDVLGVCEIGTQADLDDLQSRLKTAGLPLPYTRLCGGSDPYRRQAILSRYPIQANSSPDINFQMDGRTYQMHRGILDVNIQLPGGSVRFLGVHLKSKRKMGDYDEELMRRNEAYVLARHISQLLKGQQADLLVYGDFNDTKRSATIRSISQHLQALDIHAPDGSSWTHHWEYQDVYSRFDYIFVSEGLKNRLDKTKSRIISSPELKQASDHRPLYIEIN